VAVFPAVLDSDVLYSITTTDLLLTAAGRGLYRPHWSEKILDDVARNLAKNRRDLPPHNIQARVAAMQDAMPSAMAEPPASLVKAMTNHRGDRHVLALAVHVHAEVVVTNNLKHFKPADCAKHGVEAQSADTFMEHLAHLNQRVMIDCVTEMSSRRLKPPATVDELLDQMATSLPSTVAALRS
jgi:predicted nucleic acid-binding protein